MSEKAIIKQRILQYLDYKGVSKYECYQKTGITNGVLSKSDGLSEDNLLRFISYYTDINHTWLLTGIGGMLENNSRNIQSIEPTILYRDNPEKDEIIQLQREQIALLKEKLAQKDDVVHFTNVPSSPQQVGVAASVRDKRCKTNDH